MKVTAVNVLTSEGGHVEGVIICNFQQEEQDLKLITLLTERIQLVRRGWRYMKSLCWEIQLAII
jgi:hypothetical protein